MDSSGALWVADSDNDRVLRFATAAGKPDGAAADGVLGQPDFTSNSYTTVSRLGAAADVAVDPTSGKIFVCDNGNNRILRFGSAASMLMGAEAEAVLGQPDFTSNGYSNEPTGMGYPWGITVDSSGTLWVADSDNNRVLRFDDAANKSNGESADGVLGQPSLFGFGASTTPSGMSSPVNVEVDASGTLWVADAGNNRVLRFGNAASKSIGEDADGVLGQMDFTSPDAGTTASTMAFPDAIAMDATGTLWVADTLNSRVLRFDNAAGKSNGAAADGVLGQTNFASFGTDTTSSGMAGPSGLAVDASGALWVADTVNNRVLWFSNAAGKANGAAADRVLGQTDFASAGFATTASGMARPDGITVDVSGNLWVADTLNNRVLRFSPAPPPPVIESPRPDLLVGDKANLFKQKGDGRYNTTGAGQKIRIRKKRKVAKTHFTVQNDGNGSGGFQFRATRGNKKVKVKYFSFAGGKRRNVTGRITSGRYRMEVSAGSSFRILARARMTRQSRLRGRARRPLSLKTTASNGQRDRVVAKVILKPRR